MRFIAIIFYLTTYVINLNNGFTNICHLMLQLSNPSILPKFLLQSRGKDDLKGGNIHLDHLCRIKHISC